MDITVYLPDDLGSQGKTAGLPFSQLLRAAVIAELERINAMKQTLKASTVHALRLENQNGDGYVGRLDATLIATTGDLEVFLASDERVILYDASNLRYSDIEDPAAELEDLLDRDAYIEAMSALGETAEVDI